MIHQVQFCRVIEETLGAIKSTEINPQQMTGNVMTTLHATQRHTWTHHTVYSTSQT